MFSPAQVQAAIAQHGTIFFDAELNPVTPQAGQWFCEYELIIPEEGDDYLSDQALVEYVGPDDTVVWCDKANAFVPYGDPIRRHRVAPEHSDGDRRVLGEILVRQA